MKHSNKKFEDINAMTDFVNKCEADFERRLNDAVDEVCEVDGLKVIGLSGPTCSGKTTAAAKLIKDFSVVGREVHVVSIDDFFKDKIRELSEGDKVDFESIAAIDFDYFSECVADIFAGRPANIPSFDFVTGRRTGYSVIKPDPKDLYIFEGIQAVYPEITALIHSFSSRSVFICAEQGIDVEGVKFRPNEIRLMRRLVRDNNFRGADPEYTMFLWKSVRENEEKNIFPYASDCDIHINSTMPYEINVLSQFLRPLLESVPEGEYRSHADEIHAKLDGIEAIPTHLIPDGSLYYEFIKKES